MNIQEYKKSRKSIKIITISGGLQVKIRKLKMSDYFDTQYVPYVFNETNNGESADESKARKEFFEFLRHCVCKCVIPDSEAGFPAIVSKPESKCAPHEISFEETLSDEDAIAIYSEIDSLSKGGLSQDNLASFRQEQSVPKDTDGDGGEVQQITA